jgi:hypothetical protein
MEAFIGKSNREPAKVLLNFGKSRPFLLLCGYDTIKDTVKEEKPT